VSIGLKFNSIVCNVNSETFVTCFSNRNQMTICIRLLTLLALMFFTSCDSSRKVINDKDSSKEKDETYVSKGFFIGTIQYIANSKCNWVIIDEKTSMKFDPMNIGDADFKTFMIHDNDIYFKYRPLRRMNRCNEAQPIEVVDIQNR